MASKYIFVGLMGSGKSILGKLLASRLSLKLVDLDDLIVERAGKSIPAIFEESGEQVFRQLESDLLQDVLCSDEPIIVATGGGAVLSEHNRQCMKEKGKVVWLDASPEILATRITGDSNRPLLQAVDPLQRMQQLSQERSPLYAEVADLYINTGELSDQEAVDKIASFLSE